MSWKSKQNPLGIRGLCHFSIPVRDVTTSMSFYETILGAKLYSDEIGEYRFGFSEQDKALGRQEHIFVEIAGQRVELLGQDPGGKTPFGTHHAFDIGPNDVYVVSAHLEEHGIPFTGPVTHRGSGSANIYFTDPDGNALEFACAGYPQHTELPLMQKVPPAPGYTWDAEARKGRQVA